jgi:hypothetical protein
MGYNLGGVDFPQTTPQPSQPMISTFHLTAPPGLLLNKNQQLNQSFEFKGTYGRHVIFRSLGHLPWPTTMPSYI